MLLDRYWERVDALYKTVKDTQRDAIVKAGEMIAEAVDSGACVHIFDTGHIIDAELVYRGGGLILYKSFKYALQVTDPVRTRDRSDLDTSMDGLAAYALKASNVRPGDIMIVGSVSGRTFSAVDLAWEAKKMGVKLIVITSMVYASSVVSTHSCGVKLFEMADVVIDNCAPAAEAMLEIPGIEARVFAASGLSAAFIMWSVTSVAVEELMKRGKTPGVLKSANFPGGNDYNKTIIEPNYEKNGY